MSPSTGETPVKAAIYLRISQDRELDGLAIDRQRQDCENLAAYRGWEVVETYTDQSLSATDKTKRRPAYDRMVEDYQAGRFSAIVCYDLDRLTRQPRQLEDWIDWAQERGLALVTANGDADLSTDGGRMYARVKAAMAKGEVERKSARQSRAQRQRAEQGRAPKGVRPLGYATSGDVIQHEAAAVEAIYAAFHGGASLRGIARGLSGLPDGASGIPELPRHTRTLVMERNAKRAEGGLSPRPVPDDGPWPESTVLGILRNPRYAGFSVYTPTAERRAAVAANAERSDDEPSRGKRRNWRENVVTDDAGRPTMGQWQPLVMEDLWSSVQAKLDDPARATNRVGTDRKHLGSGLYLCGVCGERLRSSSRLSNGVSTSGYKCSTKGHLLRTGAAVDDYVTRVIVARLNEPDAQASKPEPVSPRVVGLDGLIEVQRQRIERSQRDYDAELIEADDLRRIRDEARGQIDDLERQRLVLNTETRLLPILRTDDPAQTFLDADLATRRGVIDALATVTLHPQPRGRRGFDPASVEVTWR